VSGSPRLRASVPQVALVIQPTAEEIGAFDPVRPGEALTELRPTAEQRAEGRRSFEVLVDGWRFETSAEPARQAELRERAARAAAEHQTGIGITLRAQIPGRVVRLWVGSGDAVEQGQRLLAIEAMKMENEIRAPHAGTIGRLLVEVGTLVDRNAELLSID